ncbi:MAG: tRNA (adenosine(37)-N6)-threonylcarbamoyltransferase complex ATPase subunit type 1 TsaE [Patescibacteria group bacterium]
MNTDSNYQIICDDSEATKSLAAGLAKQLRGGEVIELIGDLGAGKTTFVSGLVEALNYDQPVTSPTFSLVNIYKTDSLEINHFDLYRLDELGETLHEIEEAISKQNSVTIIEWAKQNDHIKDIIKIQIRPQVDENKRLLEFAIPDNYKYLEKALI